jgi:hypothetical protein
MIVTVLLPSRPFINKKIISPWTDIVYDTARIDWVFAAALSRAWRNPSSFGASKMLLGKNAVYAGLSALKKSK